MTGTRSGHKALVAELRTLYTQGTPRSEIHAAFAGRRGRTWINEQLLSIASEASCLARLLAMHRDGRTLAYALRMLAGEQEDFWIRQAWPRTEHASAGLYGGQNMVPRIRLELI